MLKDWINTIQKVAFWLILAFMLGSVFGATVSNRIFHWRVKEAIILERMLYDTKVYDIKEIKDIVKK